MAKFACSYHTWNQYFICFNHDQLGPSSALKRHWIVDMKTVNGNEDPTKQDQSKTHASHQFLIGDYAENAPLVSNDLSNMLRAITPNTIFH